MDKKYFPFGKRFFALTIDLLILMIFGFIAGSLFFDLLSSLGDWARLIGFIIVLLYFGIGNSCLTNGQTLGKKILKIKVVNQNGECLSKKQSFLRAIFIGAILELNSLVLPVTMMNSPIQSYIGIIFQFLVFSSLYLFLFNIKTRQTLHDLSVKSFVVNNNFETSNIEKTINPIHYLFISLIIISLIVVPKFSHAKSFDFTPMINVSNLINNQYKTNVVGFKDSSNTTHIEGKTGDIFTRALIVTIRTNNLKDSTLAQNVAKTVIKNYPNALKYNVIRIVFIKYYCLGFASANYSEWVQDSPQKWLNGDK